MIYLITLISFSIFSETKGSVSGGSNPKSNVDEHDDIISSLKIFFHDPISGAELLKVI